MSDTNGPSILCHRTARGVMHTNVYAPSRTRFPSYAEQSRRYLESWIDGEEILRLIGKPRTNVGVKTFELVTGRTPFEAGFNDRGLIPQFQSVLGAIPDGWNSDAVRDGLLKEVPDSRSR